VYPPCARRSTLTSVCHLTVASVSSPSFYPQALNHWGDALMNMAIAHTIHDRYERAWEMCELAAPKLEAALKLDPRDSRVLHVLGGVRDMQSDLKCRCGEVEKAGPYFEQAVECFRRGLKESPDDEDLKQALKEAMEEGPPTYPRQFHQMPAHPPPEKELEGTKYDEEMISRAELDLQVNPADSEVRGPVRRGSQTRNPSPAGLIIRTRLLQLSYCLEEPWRIALRTATQDWLTPVAAGRGSSVYSPCARRSTLHTSVGSLTVVSLSSPFFYQALYNWGTTLMNMAIVHYNHSIYERAWEMCELAAPKLEAALKLDPRDSRVLHVLGGVHGMQSTLKGMCEEVEKAGPYFEQAVECYRRGLKVSPDDEDLKQALKEATEYGPPR